MSDYGDSTAFVRLLLGEGSEAVEEADLGEPGNAFAALHQRVYDAAVSGAIRELDGMRRENVTSLSQCDGIVGKAAQALLDYYRENDEKVRVGSESRRKFQGTAR